MTFSTIRLQFKGNETVKEIYTIHIKELKQSIQLIDNRDFVQLRETKLALQEMLAIIQNKELMGKGYILK